MRRHGAGGRKGGLGAGTGSARFRLLVPGVDDRDAGWADDFVLAIDVAWPPSTIPKSYAHSEVGQNSHPVDAAGEFHDIGSIHLGRQNHSVTWEQMVVAGKSRP
jgi:hypothetical protein